MRRFFNYIIFHIYTFQKRVGNEDIINISISLILTVLVWLIAQTISSFLFVYFGYEFFKISIIRIILIMTIIFIPIYLYIRKKYYLEYHFEESKKGYLYFIFFAVLIYSTFLFFGNKSREKLMLRRGYTQEQIENNGKKIFNPNETPQSLEGKIRLWYYNAFEKKKDSIKK